MNFDENRCFDDIRNFDEHNDFIDDIDECFLNSSYLLMKIGILMKAISRKYHCFDELHHFANKIQRLDEKS